MYFPNLDSWCQPSIEMLVGSGALKVILSLKADDEFTQCLLVGYITTYFQRVELSVNLYKSSLIFNSGEKYMFSIKRCVLSFFKLIQRKIKIIAF